jgi:hypothetical protein
MPLPNDPTLEGLSAQLHVIYQQEARRQGDVRHQEPYPALSESIKEYDRALARWIIAHVPAMVLENMLSDPLLEEETTPWSNTPP